MTQGDGAPGCGDGGREVRFARHGGGGGGRGRGEEEGQQRKQVRHLSRICNKCIKNIFIPGAIGATEVGVTETGGLRRVSDASFFFLKLTSDWELGHFNIRPSRH